MAILHIVSSAQEDYKTRYLTPIEYDESAIESMTYEVDADEDLSAFEDAPDGAMLWTVIVNGADHSSICLRDSAEDAIAAFQYETDSWQYEEEDEIIRFRHDLADAIAKIKAGATEAIVEDQHGYGDIRIERIAKRETPIEVDRNHPRVIWARSGICQGYNGGPIVQLSFIGPYVPGQPIDHQDVGTFNRETKTFENLDEPRILRAFPTVEMFKEGVIGDNARDFFAYNDQ